MITLSIDVTKVDKDFLAPGKNGQKYLNLVLSENREGPDKYGNHGIVKQSVPKEKRDTVKLPIIGNFKVWEPRGESGRSSYGSKQQPHQDDDSGTVPF